MAALMALPAFAVNAAGFPEKPISVVVPFAAGGPTDVLTRVIVERMARELGQHTAALMEELGYTPEEVRALQQRHAVA